MAKIVTLGEIMLRLSTDVGIRLSQANHLQAHYGGGEANVGISLAHFEHDVIFASKVPTNPLGHAVKTQLRQNNVSTQFLLEGGKRLGTYYLETGVGERSAKVVYDRSDSSFASMTRLEWDLEALFKGADIFHISGVTAALTPEWGSMVLDLVRVAKEKGLRVSFDVNYRAKLWTQQACGEFLEKILPLVDYLSAGKLDAIHLLGIEACSKDDATESLYYAEQISQRFPNIKSIYATKRTVLSASANRLIGILFIDGQLYQSGERYIDSIIDRVGGGDAYSAGILHGLLNQWNPQEIVDFATAASALKHTVYGDYNPFSEQEVLEFLNSGSAIIR